MVNTEANGRVSTIPAAGSLFERIGGNDVIAAVVDDLYQRMLNGHQTWYYWKGVSADGRAAERARYTDLVGSAAGGPVDPRGLSEEASNTGLTIGKVGWGIFVELTAEALDHSGLDDGEAEELFCLLARSKAAMSSAQRTSSPAGVFAAFPHDLAERGMEVLRQVAMGKNNSEIGEELFISINTVTRHITNIFVKTSTRNRVEAAVYAARRHLV